MQQTSERALFQLLLKSALAFPWKVIHRMTECADLFLVDFKMFDNEKHKEYTGTEKYPDQRESEKTGELQTDHDQASNYKRNQ